MKTSKESPIADLGDQLNDGNVHHKPKKHLGFVYLCKIKDRGSNCSK